jgi:Nucleotidyl transferase AbiEii toxin, Type IV TA system
LPASQSERRRALERRITNAAKERGTTAARLRRLVGFAVICETLSEAVARGIIPVFFVKGGVAIELRLGLLARATRDLDIGLCAPPNELLSAFDSALDVGFGDFRMRRRGEARELDSGTLVLEVSLEYVGRPWGTVEVDLAPATPYSETDAVSPIALSELGLAPPRSVPCLAIPAQIAQKIHALTEPEPRGRPNPRARDVLDVLLLQRVEIDHAAVRAACEGIFAERATHAWPIYSFDFPPAWRGTLTELAREVRYNTDDVSVIETRFNSYLAQLQGAPIVPNYEYRFIALNYFITNSTVDSTLTPPVTESGVRYDHFQAYLKDGWRVHSTIDRAHGAGAGPELLVLLERPQAAS